MIDLFTKWPIILVSAIFVLVACVACVVIFGVVYHDGNQQILNLIILAGVVISFIDRHIKTKASDAKVDFVEKKLEENTKLTEETAVKVRDEIEEAVKNGLGTHIAEKVANKVADNAVLVAARKAIDDADITAIARKLAELKAAAFSASILRISKDVITKDAKDAKDAITQTVHRKEVQVENEKQ